MFGEDKAVRQWRSLVSHSHLHTVELARTAPGGETLHVDSHQLVLDWPGGAWRGLAHLFELGGDDSLGDHKILE